MKASVKHLMIAGPIILLGYLFAFTYVPNIIYTIFELGSKKNSFLAQVPKVRRIQETEASGKSIHFHELSFAYPWCGAEIIEKDESLIVEGNDGKRLVVIFVPNSSLFSDLESIDEEELESIRALCGQEVENDYLFRKCILETTPKELSPLLGKDKAKRVIALLELKDRMTRGWDGYAVHVITPRVKGYEIPMSHSRIVKLATSGNHVYGLDFNGVFSEGEIDKVLGTVWFNE